jgi:hypothetical protein
VTATDTGGHARLFDIEVGAVTFADDWHPIGMRASDSRTASLDIHVPCHAEVGGPGRYVGRPGFWHGGGGVAACWLGLARRVAADLAADAGRRADPYTAAAGGRAVAAITAGTAVLAAAARQIDADPHDIDAARRRAQLVRVAVEQACRVALDASVVAQGARALSFDVAHGRAVSDLVVYLGQLHHGHAAAAVAADVAPSALDAWWSA